MDARAVKHLALILVAALALRLVAAAWWQQRTEGQFLFGDSQSYWTLAEKLADGEGYQYGDRNSRIFRAPGYPLLLAPLFWFGDGEPSRLWPRLEGAVLGMLAVGATWWLGRELFTSPAAPAAAWLAALYPGAIATSVLVLSESAFCPLMMLQLAVWVAALRASDQWRAVGTAGAAGLIGGLATLVRPSWLLFTPLVALLAVLLGKRRRRQLLVGAGLLVGLALAMAPWWIRNAAITGRFVPTTLQVGASLYDGWNPRATGASDMYFVSEAIVAQRQAESRRGGPLAATFEWRLDRSLRRAAWHWAAEHPGEVLRLAGRKFIRMWNLWPNEPQFSSWPVRLMFAGSYVPVMLLALWGLVRTIDRPWPYALCWLPAVYFTGLHMVFVSSIRYRQPAMLPLLVLAASALVGWAQGKTESNETQPATMNSDLNDSKNEGGGELGGSPSGARCRTGPNDSAR